jgi:transcriptional regulator with XRE-family HTH domain
MTTLGSRVREARKAKGWSQDNLARRASMLPGAPDVTAQEVGFIERGKTAFRLGRPKEEPLGWVLTALGLGAEVVAEALGMAA